MMRILYLTIFLGLVPFFSSAQQDQKGMNVKQKAKVILDRVKSKHKTAESIKVDFSFKLENKKRDNFKEVREGTATIKGDKFRVNLGSHLIICDNNTVWTYLKEADEVQVNTYKPDQMKINPSEMFTLYKEGFLYGYKGEKTVDGKPYYRVELTPENKEKSFYKIRLLVNQDDYHISQTKVFEKDGSIYTYDFKNYRLDQNIATKQFTFNKQQHPNVTVIDLRK